MNHHPALRPEEDDAEEAYRLGKALVFADRLNAGVSHLRRALQSKPHYRIYCMQEAEMLAGAQMFSRAAAFYTAILHAAPQQQTELLARANLLVRQRRFDLAIPCYWALLRVNENNLDARMGLALCLAGSGQLEAAIKQYRWILRIDEKLLEARVRLAETLVAAGELRAAAAEYEKALEDAHGDKVMQRRIRRRLEELSAEAPGDPSDW